MVSSTQTCSEADNKAALHSAVRAAHAPDASHFLDTSGATGAHRDASQGPDIPECYCGAQIPSAGTSVVTKEREWLRWEEEGGFSFVWKESKQTGVLSRGLVVSGVINGKAAGKLGHAGKQLLIYALLSRCGSR